MTRMVLWLTVLLECGFSEHPDMGLAVVIVWGLQIIIVEENDAVLVCWINLFI